MFVAILETQQDESEKLYNSSHMTSGSSDYDETSIEKRDNENERKKKAMMESEQKERDKNTAELMKELDEYYEGRNKNKSNETIPTTIYINVDSTQAVTYTSIIDEGDIQTKITYNENLSNNSNNGTVHYVECTSSQNLRNIYACVFCGSRDHNTGQHNKELASDGSTQSSNYTSDGSYGMCSYYDDASFHTINDSKETYKLVGRALTWLIHELCKEVDSRISQATYWAIRSLTTFYADAIKIAIEQGATTIRDIAECEYPQFDIQLKAMEEPLETPYYVHFILMRDGLYNKDMIGIATTTYNPTIRPTKSRWAPPWIIPNEKIKTWEKHDSSDSVSSSITAGLIIPAK